MEIEKANIEKDIENTDTKKGNTENSNSLE